MVCHDSKCTREKEFSNWFKVASILTLTIRIQSGATPFLCSRQSLMACDPFFNLPVQMVVFVPNQAQYKLDEGILTDTATCYSTNNAHIGHPMAIIIWIITQNDVAKRGAKIINFNTSRFASSQLVKWESFQLAVVSVQNLINAFRYFNLVLLCVTSRSQFYQIPARNQFDGLRQLLMISKLKIKLAEFI